MTNSTLDILLIADSYDRKARLRPGVFVVVPLTIAAVFGSWDSLEWYSSLGVGSLVQIFLMVIAAHLGRAMGHRVELKLIEKQGGLPTHRWLRPDDTTKSRQQKQQWYDSIKEMTGFDIPASAVHNPHEVDKLIDDAISQLRHRIRYAGGADLVRIHNEEYGFVRNLSGLWPIWLLASVLGTIVCVLSWLWADASLVGVFIEIICILLACALRSVLPGYLDRAAERYAESFFASTVLLAESQRSQE